MFFKKTFVDFMMMLLSNNNLKAQELIIEACDKTRDTWSLELPKFDELTSIISTISIFLTYLRKLRLTTCENQLARAMINFLS